MIAGDVVLEVHPASSKNIHCQIAVSEKEGRTEEYLPLQVKVSGAQGVFDWRLSLYEKNQSGANLSVSQIGKESLKEESTFLIPVKLREIAQVSSASPLSFELLSQNRKVAHCLLYLDLSR